MTRSGAAKRNYAAVASSDPLVYPTRQLRGVQLIDGLNQLSGATATTPTWAGSGTEIFSHPLQVTSSIAVSYGPHCPPCRWST